jgi:hypothetical protein
VRRPRTVPPRRSAPFRPAIYGHRPESKPLHQVRSLARNRELRKQLAEPYLRVGSESLGPYFRVGNGNASQLKPF